MIGIEGGLRRSGRRRHFCRCRRFFYIVGFVIG